MITTRGNFEAQLNPQPTYMLVYYHWVQGDPCGWPTANIYIDLLTNIYYYSTDGVNFYLAGCWWFSYSYYDWGTDQYYYDGFNIISGFGGSVSYIGTYSSPCGPA
jgi:hypothetical protein